MLEVTDTREDEVVVLALKGRLDTATAADFDFAAEPHTDKPTRLLVDLAGVQYVSSAGLRVFLMLAKKLQKAQGKFVLCGLNSTVREVFDLAGFSKILQIEADRAAGINRLNS